MLERETDLCRESASGISHRLPWKEELQDKIGQIELVDEVARILTSTLDIDEVYEGFAQELKKLVDFDRADINLVDLQMSQSTLKYLYGETLPNLPLGSSVELQGSQIAEVIATGKTIIRKDLTADAAFHNDKRFLELGLRSNIM